MNIEMFKNATFRDRLEDSSAECLEFRRLWTPSEDGSTKWRRFVTKCDPERSGYYDSNGNFEANLALTYRGEFIGYFVNQGQACTYVRLKRKRYTFISDFENFTIFALDDSDALDQADEWLQANADKIAAATSSNPQMLFFAIRKSGDDDCLAVRYPLPENAPPCCYCLGCQNIGKVGIRNSEGKGCLGCAAY